MRQLTCVFLKITQARPRSGVVFNATDSGAERWSACAWELRWTNLWAGVTPLQLQTCVLDAETAQIWNPAATRCKDVFGSDKRMKVFSLPPCFRVPEFLKRNAVPREAGHGTKKLQGDSLFLPPLHTHTHTNVKPQTKAHTFWWPHTCTVIHRHVGEHARYTLRVTETDSWHKMTWSHDQTKNPALTGRTTTATH